MPYENETRNGCLVLCCLNTHVTDAAAKYWKRNARKERKSPNITFNVQFVNLYIVACST